MKLRKKVFAGFAATVLALTMMVSSAFAQTIATIDAAAGAKEPDKGLCWVRFVDGTNCDGTVAPYYDGIAAIYNQVASIDFVVDGACTVEYHIIYEGAYSPDGTGYDNNTFKAVPLTVDGVTVVNQAFDGSVLDGTMGASVAFLMRNKSEGALAFEAFIFRNADGAIIGGQDGSGFLDAAAATALSAELTGVDEGAADTADDAATTDDASATEAATDASADAAPKTGVESFGLIFGLGAAVLGSGAVVLKKKSR
jgi:LPXTG-motif cell wall-anchored protein